MHLLTPTISKWLVYFSIHDADAFNRYFQIASFDANTYNISNRWFVFTHHVHYELNCYTELQFSLEWILKCPSISMLNLKLSLTVNSLKNSTLLEYSEKTFVLRYSQSTRMQIEIGDANTFYHTILTFTFFNETLPSIHLNKFIDHSVNK